MYWNASNTTMYLFHYHTDNADYYELLDLTKGKDKLSSFVKEKS